jgi:hypothetical protein
MADTLPHPRLAVGVNNPTDSPIFIVRHRRKAGSAVLRKSDERWPSPREDTATAVPASVGRTTI